MYVKLIDGKIENAPKVLRDDQNTYANPLPETLRAFGYKPLVETECPNEEGYNYTFEYQETENQIEKIWVAHEIIVEPEPAEAPVEEPVSESETQVEASVIEETPAENVSEDDESGQENVQESEIVEE